jgi:hypothetical protein
MTAQATGRSSDFRDVFIAAVLDRAVGSIIINQVSGAVGEKEREEWARGWAGV